MLRKSISMQISYMLRRKSTVFVLLVLLITISINFFINMKTNGGKLYVSQMYSFEKMLTLSDNTMVGYFMMQYYPLLVVIPTGCVYISERNSGIDTYIQENAREYVGKAVVKESKELQEKPMPEVTAFLEEKGIYDPEFLWGLYKKVIEDKLPALLSSLKLSLVVEERINAMQVEEVEELVLSIMNKELGAIVNLGAVIGLILGLINVIIFII